MKLQFFANLQSSLSSQWSLVQSFIQDFVHISFVWLTSLREQSHTKLMQNKSRTKLCMRLHWLKRLGFSTLQELCISSFGWFLSGTSVLDIWIFYQTNLIRQTFGLCERHIQYPWLDKKKNKVLYICVIFWHMNQVIYLKFRPR